MTASGFFKVFDTPDCNYPENYTEGLNMLATLMSGKVKFPDAKLKTNHLAFIATNDPEMVQ